MHRLLMLGVLLAATTTLAQAKKKPQEQLPPGLTGAEIAQGIAPAQTGIQGCYRREVDEHHQEKGAVHVRLTVAASGGRASAALLSNDFSKELGDCVVSVVQSQTAFPAPRGGSFTTEYAFTFGPVN